MKSTLSLLLVALTLLVSGCGQAVEAPSSAPLPGGGIFQVALPRIVVDVDSSGNPSVLGISPALLSTFGVDVSSFRLPKSTVDQILEAKIQHIEIASVGDRLMLFADGKPLPYLGWSQDSLSRALAFTELLDVQNAQTLKQLVPLITRLGLDVVLRFPVQSGETVIPLVNVGMLRSWTPTITTEPVSAIIKFEIRFDETGQPGLMGLSPKDLAALGITNVGRLGADTITKLQQGNVQHVELRTKPDGFHIYVNGEALPTLVWDTESLSDISSLASRLAPDAGLLPLIQNIVPQMDRGDIGILMHFPIAAGQQAIPAQMH